MRSWRGIGLDSAKRRDIRQSNALRPRHVLGLSYALGSVNAGVAGKEIRDDARHAGVGSDLGTEQFHSHDGRGDRRIGGTGKYGDET